MTQTDGELLQCLVRARSDPRLLAATLPRAKVQPVALVLLLLFCFGMLVWSVVMPLVMSGPLVGSLAVIGSGVGYLAIRPLAKRAGWLSVGAFTVDREGVFRTLSGIGQARRRIRKRGDDVSLRANWGLAIVFLSIVIGLPVVVIMLTDRPEIMLGWMVMAMLALNEMVLLVVRTRVDVRRRDAAAVDGAFGLSLIADYLDRGGGVRPLLDGIRLDRLVPEDEPRFRAVIQDAIRRRARAEAMQV